MSRESDGGFTVGGRSGFTLLEMLVSMGIFMLIFASAFTLLGVSQQRYQAESQVLNSFEEARLGLDQIVRDFSDAGYPPPSHFENIATTNPTQYADTPIAWSPGYPATPCSMAGFGVTCVSPFADGMFIETNPTPQIPGSTVQYIRYKLGDTSTTNTTLFRRVIPKPNPVQDPYLTIPTNTLVPFVQNVMNQASAAQIAQINAQYPNMFPGGNPVPIFTYTCDTPTGPQDCTTAGAYGAPTNIRSVTITLIVATPTPDPQTGRIRVVELTGRASRANSFQ
jgi:type II secretory pathway pseudopilin PulG